MESRSGSSRSWTARDEITALHLPWMKQEYLSVPNRSISYFSLKTAGHFDMDAELKIWIGSHPEPIRKEFKRGGNIKGIPRLLAQYTC